MVYIAETQNAAPVARPAGNQPSLEDSLRAAREHARRITELYGTNHPDVAVAWDTVEELMTAKARQREAGHTAFATYCERYPDAPECRIYDI